MADFFCITALWRKLLPITVLASQLAWGLDDELLMGVELDDLEFFTLVDDTTEEVEDDAFDHSLVQSRAYLVEGRRHVRYDQYYRGLKVVGRSVVGHYDTGTGGWYHTEGRFYGKVAKGIDVPDYRDYLTDDFRQAMFDVATKDFTSHGKVGSISRRDTQPIIWIDRDEKARLAYQVNFQAQPSKGIVKWPHYVIAVKDSEILEYWDNVQEFYSDQAPGGNTKTGPYTYGSLEMPEFSVSQQGDLCFLGNARVKVLSLHNGSSTQSTTPFSYACDQNVGNPVNGAFSPENDAYVFSNLVISMFQNWYQTAVHTSANGQPKQLTVLVNVGNNYENAFWDGSNLAFGDGYRSYYPLVSVSIVAHELSHAFTENHSNLIYANQSGSINESFSDMAAIAAEYYLKIENPQAYRVLIGKNSIDWRIGDRISKGGLSAMRSMENPSAYSSAECEEQVSGCQHSWDDVLRLAQQIGLANRQSYIVHKGSGIINRAFVHIVNGLGGDVRTAFGLMVRANMLYWTSAATFSEAACGVKQAAEVDGVSVSLIDDAFRLVGVTPDC